jgi:hypothetical protein
LNLLAFDALALHLRISQAPVGLTVQVGAAGAVASVQITNPDRSLWLVAKAVGIAKTKL